MCTHGSLSHLSCVSVLTSVQMESSRCRLGDWQTDSPLLGKKMIQPDHDLMCSLLNFSDEEDSGDSGDDHDHQEDHQRLRLETSAENEDRKSSWRKQREYLGDVTIGEKWTELFLLDVAK